MYRYHKLIRKDPGAEHLQKDALVQTVSLFFALILPSTEEQMLVYVDYTP